MKWMTCAAILLLLGAPESNLAQPVLTAAPLFSNSWCPEPEDLSELQTYFEVRMNGCCIHVVDPKPGPTPPPELLSKWSARSVPPGSNLGFCIGETKAMEAERKAAERKAHEEKVRELPSRIRGLSLLDFCVDYGVLARGFVPYGMPETPSLKPAYEAEARRRGLSVSALLAKREEIGLKVSRCQLYASWGAPQGENRSVGSWGEHIQHIYGRSYVYTRNGVVTSWQD